MTSQVVKMNLPTDAEARPVAMIVQIASQFESKILIVDGNKKINAKSIMGMMSLNFVKDNEVSIEAEGSDEKEAIEALATYICSGK